MKKQSFNNISIRGRVAFCILCFEKYVEHFYHDLDFSSVLQLMWSIVGDSDYIDNSAYHYMEIIPEYLYEFDSYEASGFEYITSEDYSQFTAILPADDHALNLIMHKIYDITMEYAYEGIPSYGKNTIDYVFDVINVLKDNSIPLPDISSVSFSTFDQHDGWGDFIFPKSI